MGRVAHPIPYQGSKRNLAPLIGQYIPSDIKTWFEPFAGSAAMTLWAAQNKRIEHFVISDVLQPISQLWKLIIEKPSQTTDRYELIWKGQSNSDLSYFNKVRERYNSDRDPVDLLYLICRCVKNAIRFNKHGKFTQSVDKRRLGMNPIKMRSAIEGASYLLKGRTEVRTGDWLETTADARSCDFVYMDPPYFGITVGRDKRYAEQLQQGILIEGLESLNQRKLRFALSYDGMTGTKEYAPALPDNLNLTRLLLAAGTSSQATLSGRKEETIESLYLPKNLLAASSTRIVRSNTPKLQESLAL